MRTGPLRRPRPVVMTTQVERPPVTDLASAHDEIPYVETPAEAEKLIGTIKVLRDLEEWERLSEGQQRAWKVVRLKAERRYGELLPPKRPGERTDKQPLTGSKRSGAAHKREHDARKVADVPQDEFEDYVRTAKSPTRSGLLAGNKPREPGPKLSDEEVDRKTWPLFDRGLGPYPVMRKTGIHETPVKNAYQRWKGAKSAPRGRPKNWNGKSNATRLREIRQNDLGKLNQLAMDINRLCRTLEGYRPDDYTPDEDSVWHIAAIYEDLISLTEWASRSLSATQGWLGDSDVRQKIERLRDTHGRTPEEAETAKRLADLLERKLGARLEG